MAGRPLRRAQMVQSAKRNPVTIGQWFNVSRKLGAKTDFKMMLDAGKLEAVERRDGWKFLVVQYPWSILEEGPATSENDAKRKAVAAARRHGWFLKQNPSLRDYAAAVTSKAAKAGRAGAEAVARKAREMAEEAEQHAARLEESRKAASVSPDRALEVLAKEHGYRLVKANPAGWMHDESSRAVRRAIATRSPDDIRRARALQVRNEKARAKERMRLPNPKKNSTCSCGCGGKCGKKKGRR